MNELQILVKDEPGTLGRIADCLNAVKIRINAFSIEHKEPDAVIHLVTSNNEKAKKTLISKSFKILGEEGLFLTIPDEAGQLARIGRILGENGINITNAYLLEKRGGKKYLSINTSNNPKTKEILKKTNLI
ncbi:MAG: ACT domain-containing protein [Candidatus Micrarchaeota archaeon]